MVPKRTDALTEMAARIRTSDEPAPGTASMVGRAFGQLGGFADPGYIGLASRLSSPLDAPHGWPLA